MGERRLIIAIDGPSGAGKGTVARTLAHALSYTHVDTGSMYRAVAWLAGHLGLDLQDEAAVAKLARDAALEVGSRVSVDGHDVTVAIRTPEMDRAAAVVARHPQVRAALVERQRTYGRDGGVVMEGRDIGTVVFPDADLKVFLTATPEARARRRLLQRGDGIDPGALAREAEQLARRDAADASRDVAPLRRPPDAIDLDTSAMDFEEQVSRNFNTVSSGFSFRYSSTRSKSFCESTIFVGSRSICSPT